MYGDATSIIEAQGFVGRLVRHGTFKTVKADSKLGFQVQLLETVLRGFLVAQK